MFWEYFRACALECHACSKQILQVNGQKPRKCLITEQIKQANLTTQTYHTYIQTIIHIQSHIIYMYTQTYTCTYTSEPTTVRNCILSKQQISKFNCIYATTTFLSYQTTHVAFQPQSVVTVDTRHHLKQPHTCLERSGDVSIDLSHRHQNVDNPEGEEEETREDLGAGRTTKLRPSETGHITTHD